MLEYYYSFFRDENELQNEPFDEFHEELGLTKNEYEQVLQQKKEEIKQEEYDDSSDTIIDIRVAKAQYGVKCFEIVYKEDSEFISYIQIINRPKQNPTADFSIACRNAISKDIYKVKKRYFEKHSKKGEVKCQETGIKSKWTELAVDHRQPNTFSVIVDRFIELKEIKVEKIEYEINKDNMFIFADKTYSEAFKQYHKDKANLRIVRKECNLSRTYQARISRQKKDLTIE